ncbi:MAG: DUF3127 domain-containing protein [Candidatus Cryptobacteroides sp.]
MYKSPITGGTTKTGRQWAKMTIVLDVPDYGGLFRKIALNVGTDMIQDVQQVNVGETVDIGYKVTAREYQGKWYNNVDLYKISGVVMSDVSSPAPVQEPEPVPKQEDLPF